MYTQTDLVSSLHPPGSSKYPQSLDRAPFLPSQPLHHYVLGDGSSSAAASFSSLRLLPRIPRIDGGDVLLPQELVRSSFGGALRLGLPLARAAGLSHRLDDLLSYERLPESYDEPSRLPRSVLLRSQRLPVLRPSSADAAVLQLAGAWIGHVGLGAAFA